MRPQGLRLCLIVASTDILAAKFIIGTKYELYVPSPVLEKHARTRLNV